MSASTPRPLTRMLALAAVASLAVGLGATAWATPPSTSETPVSTTETIPTTVPTVETSGPATEPPVDTEPVVATSDPAVEAPPTTEPTAGSTEPGFDISPLSVGSRIEGTVWADTDRDGAHDTAETVKAGVTIDLLDAGGGVVASTTSAATGRYSFADMADGDYNVRVDALGPFVFPATASGDNAFVRAGQPLPGDPERGVSAALTVAGPSQITDIDAGMQPIADLRVERLALATACDGFAQTGTPPFDATEGPGLDTGTGNCIVRTGDTVRQQYAVSLTGLPSGTTVPNVVVELTVSSPDGAALALAGPGPNGIPGGCLSAANGANPPSGRTLNPDGSITVRCNVGAMSSNVAALELNYRVTTASAVPSHAGVAVHSFAGQGDAGRSSTVSGPIVEVTGSAEWTLDKTTYQGVRATSRVIDGVVTQGFQLWYIFALNQPSGATGNGQLDWPITFTDQLTEFPNARPVECVRVSPGRGFPSSWGENWMGLTCPLNQAQGADGWQLQIAPLNDSALNDTRSLMAMDVFVPEADIYRVLDPDWQPGDDRPVGTVAWENHAIDTDGWAMNGGQLNNGDGFEPGWDGTTASGDNVTTHSLNVTEPRWDLSKSRAAGPTFATRTIDGQTVVGYEIWYNFAVSETNGALFAGFIDEAAFRDRLVTHPDTHLISCRAMPSGGAANTGTPTCETGVQPTEGWDMSIEPSQRGLDLRTAQFQALFFIPADAIAVDPCQASPTDTFRVRNEAVGSDGWTVDGEPINGETGLERGWDGTTATGNNVVDQTYTIRSTVGDCGTLTGRKGWTFGPTLTWPGRQMGTQVWVTASNDRVVVPDVGLCDVFDVSVLLLADVNWYGPGELVDVVSSGTIDPANYVVEYAIGPNETRTQAPTDFTSIQGAANGCRDHDGVWLENPRDFGADWQDRVNMIRVRPIEAGRVETGPFMIQLQAQLTTRGVYNGGPNDGDVIPSGVRVTNVGGFTSRGNAARWATETSQVPFQGMVLAIAKTVPQAQYLPGDSFRWGIGVRIGQAFDGATMQNVRVVDTLPDGLIYDAACTTDLLPDGVTATYDPIANTVTFLFGDIEVEQAPNHDIAGWSKPNLQVCTTVPSLAQPGDFHRNDVQAFADNSANAPTAAAQVQIAGAGQMGITKSVDKPFVASGEQYTWSLEWGNTSTVVAFQAPDVIDVLPWNGDGDPGSGSARSQFQSDYSGLVQLTGPLAAPTYLRGGTGGAVQGTWYYATADPATLNHDPRDASNAAPAAAGGRWLAAAEVSDFGTVTAVRFVSQDFLPVQSRVRALIPAVSTSNDLDNVYVNRAMVFSATVPDQPLLSNEPYVLMPGFTLGDLVWIDGNGNGTFDDGELGVSGVTVQVRNEDGDVVATRTTDANGRWSVDAIPAGTYTVEIPASMFAPGAPLAGTAVRTTGSSDANAVNETGDNNNTPTPDPAATGLTSSPVTLAYVHQSGRLVGGNGPSGDDVMGLAGELVSDPFTTFTVDLAVVPAPGIDIEKHTNGVDADEPTGPVVTVGDEVTWTYVVTNTGSVDLFGVTVTDDMLADVAIDCGDGTNVVAGPLAPQQSFTCQATGVAIVGQYANVGSVTAADELGERVTDEDPSHYFGEEPSVDTEPGGGTEPPVETEPSVDTEPTVETEPTVGTEPGASGTDDDPPAPPPAVTLPATG